MIVESQSYELNAEQQLAVDHGHEPLLIVAGAGTGKTRTLVHRVARLIQQGVAPNRLLLLIFTRRAAAEMLRRVDQLLRLQGGSGTSGSKVWGGTFHATAARLLRIHGNSIGLDPDFTIHDRSDSEDLLDVVRTELGLSQTNRRFPKKGSCMAIYSRCVNSQQPLEDLLAESYPWCRVYAADLKRLFIAYVERKGQAAILDYDDLLLFWQVLLEDDHAGQQVRRRFDAVLVDEYQDTNRLQADILRLLRQDGLGLTAVGDDAQSIYSFRAATVRNILDFPDEYPGTRIIKLQQNYRSTQPILAATNAVIACAAERHDKQLWSARCSNAKPALVTCVDETDQAHFVVNQVLGHREEGIDLRRQAVLFRASHHTIVLEAELARRNIPFVKYGGLKFMEAAHVKDLLAFLRLAENPNDVVAGARMLMLLPGIGPRTAQQLMHLLAEHDGGFAAWQSTRVPAAASAHWSELVNLMQQLAGSPPDDLATQFYVARNYYKPLLEMRFDNSEARLRDLEQLEQLASRYCDRRSMLVEMALEPPSSTQDLAGPTGLDEDYLVLSTIHSAKGLEWDAVYVIHATDGNIPSDRAAGSAEQIEEERRLFYVALTRAKTALSVCVPQRIFHGSRGGTRDEYGYAQPSRFLPVNVRRLFQCHVSTMGVEVSDHANQTARQGATRARERAKAIWS